jgi:tetratricopeptide (TPR) repeat protein
MAFFRYQKRINLGGGLRLNLSKRGVGVSGGVRGARVGVGPRGTRASVGVPGSGLYYISEKRFKKGKTANSSASTTAASDAIDGVFQKQFTGTKLAVACVLIGLLFWPFLIVGIGIAFFCFLSSKLKSYRLFNRALGQYQQGNVEKATELLQESNDLNSGNHETIKLLIHILADEFGLHEKAVGYIQEFEKFAVLDPWLIFTKARCLFQMKRYDEVVEIMQRRGDGDERESVAILLGRCFYEKGMFEVAEEQFLKCQIRSRTRTDELMLEARYWLGLTLLKLGKKARAKTQLSKVYAVDSGYRDMADYADILSS